MSRLTDEPPINRQLFSRGAAADALRLLERDDSPEGKVLAAEAAFRAAEDAPGEWRPLDRAVEAAEAATQAAPGSGGAHFWLGVSLTARARAHGLWALLRSAGRIRDELETAARLDPAFQQGAPLAALCSLYHHAPRPPLSFGDAARSAALCRQALAVDPANYEAHVTLAEQARKAGDRTMARAHLAAVLEAQDPERPRTLAAYVARATKIAEDLR